MQCLYTSAFFPWQEFYPVYAAFLRTGVDERELALTNRHFAYMRPVFQAACHILVERFSRFYLYGKQFVVALYNAVNFHAGVVPPKPHAGAAALIEAGL